jgi:phenylacetate-coenzyme A ligase PaaK-like adenylate-forming protein
MQSWSEIAHLPAAELRRRQDERLRRFLREQVVPFSTHYRRVFEQAGLRAKDVRGVADLARLPFTTKQDLLAAQSDPERKRDFLLVPTPESIRAHWGLAKKLDLLAGGEAARAELRREYTPNFPTFTTGRSADPVVYLFTPYDLRILAEAGARMLDVHGITDPLARIVNLFPFAPHLAFWQSAWAGFETGRMMLSTGGGKVMGTPGNLRVLERVQPQVLLGTPGFVYHLLREGADRQARVTEMKLVILGAEKLSPGLKHKMSEALARLGSPGVLVLGTYGFTEARMAFTECPTALEVSSGYHLYPDLGVFEVIDPASGRVLGEGETGELVYTPLDGRGTVALRYRTGDVAMGGITWEPCPHCRRTVPRVASDLRRVSDQRSMSLTKIKGTLVDLAAMGALLSGQREIEEWQVVLQKKDDDPHELDELLLRLALRPGVDPARYEGRIREELLAGVEVAPNRVEFLETKRLLDLLGMETELKEKRFVDRRPREEVPSAASAS